MTTTRRLWCLDDEGRWGQALAKEAERRKGVEALLFTAATYAGIFDWKGRVFDAEPVPEYAFMRINQGGQRMLAEMAAAQVLERSDDLTLIPDIRQIEVYESKLAQVAALGDFKPRTHVIRGAHDWRDSVDELGLPFVSKASDGSGSINVNLVRTRADAEREWHEAFGPGIERQHKLGLERQREYLYWQEFLADNDCDYRVIRVGRHYMILRRLIRSPDRPFASGSGKLEPIARVDFHTVPIEMLHTAVDCLDHLQTRFCGIDLVQHPSTGEWLVLECTLGWTWDVYVDCEFFTWEDNHVVWTGRKGGATWQVLCDDLEAGVFDE